MHIQFNIVSSDTLLAARREPERHKDLAVRVAGYSAYFVNLPKTMQEEISVRTEHGSLWPGPLAGSRGWIRLSLYSILSHIRTPTAVCLP